MTRLIDADALKREWIFTGDNSKGYRDAIDEAPTVDAIPIEFIMERMNGYYEHGYTEFGACLETLIEDWREEHAVD